MSRDMLAFSLHNSLRPIQLTNTTQHYTDWDGITPFTSAPPFYEGVDDFTAHTLDQVSQEILAIKAALLEHHPHLNLDAVRHVREWIMDAYDHHIVDTSSLRSCIVTNKAYVGLKHPMVPAPAAAADSSGGGASAGLVPNTSHRFWVEDLPCGMVATRGIAELAGVDTPTIDAVIMVSHKAYPLRL